MLWNDPTYFKWNGNPITSLSNDYLLCAIEFKEETGLNELAWTTEVFSIIANKILTGKEKIMHAPKFRV